MRRTRNAKRPMPGNAISRSMGYDGPNFEGANIRQVLTQGDQASQLQAARRDTADFQSRM